METKKKLNKYEKVRNRKFTILLRLHMKNWIDLLNTFSYVNCSELLQCVIVPKVVVPI